MKKLLIFNIVVAVGIPILRFWGEIFSYGGCPVSFAPVIAMLCGLTLMFLMLGFFVLLVFDVIYIVRSWKINKFRSLVLPGILAMGVVISNFTGGTGITIAKNRFQKYLPEYDAVVEMIQNNKIRFENGMLPLKYRHLAYIVLTNKDENGVLTVEFVVGGIAPPPRHTVYLYSSNGNIEEGSYIAKRWHHRDRVNEHWFRVKD